MIDVLNPIDYPLIGGILLIVGALLISEFGKIYIASIPYLLADICWIMTAYQNDNNITVGVMMVIIGTILGLRTFLKMHNNIYHKDLNITDNQNQLNLSNFDKGEICIRLHDNQIKWYDGWYVNKYTFISNDNQILNLEEIHVIGGSLYKKERT